MSLKLSPGCTCCDAGTPCISCSESTIQTEYDLIMSGLTDGTDCDICEDLNGSFTLTDRIEVDASSLIGLSDDGWSQNGGRAERANDEWSQAADVPSGATSACVWNYKVPSPFNHGVSCGWTETLGTPPFGTTIDYRLVFYGYTLAKFKISDTDYKWRLIVNFQLRLICQDFMGGYDADYLQDGWYWEMSESTTDCHLSTSDSWTGVVPATFSVSVFCMDSATAGFSDWCAGTLSLTSVEDG